MPFDDSQNSVAVGDDTPAPPPGFKVRSSDSSVPPPPPGFSLRDDSSDSAPPPPGFKLRGGADSSSLPAGEQYYYRNDITVQPHGHLQRSRDGENWEDVPADENAYPNPVPLTRPQADQEIQKLAVP